MEGATFSDGFASFFEFEVTVREAFHRPAIHDSIVDEEHLMELYHIDGFGGCWRRRDHRAWRSGRSRHNTLNVESRGKL